MSSSLNLGIVAHVDAGKTSLTERLLFEAGVVATPGSVDAGTTRTDSMELERRRGITIRAAVTSFSIGGLVVNLVDTPGHPDFVAEVERCLGVLDAAVLVLSSVEGVQAQTVVIWRALRRIGIPTVLFVNKVDRAGSDVGRVLEQVRRRLTPAVVELAEVRDQGGAAARVTAVPLTEESVVSVVAGADDQVLARWVAGEAARRPDVLRALRQGVRHGALTGLVYGSAITGAGMPQLRGVLREIMPRAARRDGSLAGTVFAVDRDGRGRRAWVRLWSGELRVRQLVVIGRGRPERVTELAVSEPGGPRVGAVARSGQITVVRGPEARIGDTIGRPPRRRTHRFPPATLQALVEPEDPTQRSALFAALEYLADEDPLIDLHLDQAEGQAAVSLHGEVQKQVISALLEQRFGVRAQFRATTVVCLERVVGGGASADRIRLSGNPYLAGIGLRVRAAPTGSGVEFSPGVERGNLPPAFITATEQGVRSALRQGLRGWEVTDCTVTMTESDYWPRQSKPHQKFDKSISTVAADFRNLAPVVVLAALAQAGTHVCQPVDRFELEVPDEAFGPVTSLLGRLQAAILDTVASTGHSLLVGHLPSAAVPELASRLPGMTGGEGVLVSEVDHYSPVTGDRTPSRRRTGIDPLDRATWFRDVPR